jgi:folate-dependent phosphoribosylglycinamide formyltransferase PurN
MAKLRVALMCQEEPVFMAPFLQRVLRARPEQIVAVFLAGHRSAGEKRGNRKQFYTSLKIAWHIMEPLGVLRALALQQRVKLLGRFDPLSVEGQARRLQIPVHRVEDANSEAFHALLRRVDPDVVLNQSELLLKEPVLKIPRLGFINRHASLLPRFRGRLGSFWAHAAEPPSYGLTIHFVDKGIDTGPIIEQVELADVDPSWSFPRTLQRMMQAAPELIWRAIDQLEDPEFTPRQHTPVDKPRRFPGLKTARRYSETMTRRRGRRSWYMLLPNPLPW